MFAEPAPPNPSEANATCR